MSSDQEPFLLGKCGRVRDAMAWFHIRGRWEHGAIEDIENSSHKLFPPNGELELKGFAPHAVKVGDWAGLTAVQHGAPRKQTFRVKEHWPLHQFIDLSPLQDRDAIRRLVVEQGRQDFPLGEAIVQISETEVVRVKMSRADDGSARATRGDFLVALPVWHFERSAVLDVVDGGRRMALFNARHPLHQVGTVNWTSNLDALRRLCEAIVKSGPVSPLFEFASAISKSPAAAELLVHALPTVNHSEAWNSLRSGELFALLSNESDFLKAFFDAIRIDQAFGALVKDRILDLARDDVDRETERLRVQMLSDLGVERVQLEAQAKQDARMAADQLANELMADIDVRVASQERETQQELDRRLERQRQLSAEIEALDSEIVTKRAVTAEYSEKEQQLLAKVEKLAGIAANLSEGGGSASVASIPSIYLPVQTEAQLLALDELSATIANFSLLNADGKQRLLQFIVALLAGEVPLLHGKQCVDFLMIASHLLAAGRYVRFDADPTIIAFDDLWFRPGSRTSTQLRQCALQVQHDGSIPQLCCIANADFSGARFWFPSLVHAKRHGALPRRLLVAATLADVDSEEAQILIAEGIAMRLDDVIAQGAAVVAPALMSGPLARPSRIEFSTEAIDREPATAFLAELGDALSVNDANRFSRLFGAARLVVPEAEATGLVLALVGAIKATLGFRDAGDGQLRPRASGASRHA